MIVVGVLADQIDSARGTEFEGRARAVQVSVQLSTNQAQTTVQDDGVGFEPALLAGTLVGPGEVSVLASASQLAVPVVRRARVAIFVDSCFWHACPWHCRRPSSNTAYWTAKMARNRARDRAVNRALRGLGWRVVRVWEHQLADPGRLERAVARVCAALGSADCVS